MQYAIYNNFTYVKPAEMLKSVDKRAHASSLSTSVAFKKVSSTLLF